MGPHESSKLRPECQGEAGCVEMVGRTMSGGGHSECKGPEVGEGLVGSVDREEARLAGAQLVGRSLLVVGGQVETKAGAKQGGL